MAFRVKAAGCGETGGSAIGVGDEPMGHDEWHDLYRDTMQRCKRIPSCATLRRALIELDIGAFEHHLARYHQRLDVEDRTSGRVETLDGQELRGQAVDGKTLRGASAHGDKSIWSALYAMKMLWFLSIPPRWPVSMSRRLHKHS